MIARDALRALVEETDPTVLANLRGIVEHAPAPPALFTAVSAYVQATDETVGTAMGIACAGALFLAVFAEAEASAPQPAATARRPVP